MVATVLIAPIFAEIDIDSNRLGRNHASTPIDDEEPTMTEQLDVLDPVTRQHVERAAEALQREFEGIFSQETIARYIAESTDLLSGAKINVFVPVLVHRFTRERLKALGQAQGSIVKEQPEVLFVCVHNAGRSQMAAGLVKLRSEGRIHVRSAGSAPADEINPAVVDAMSELGVDMSEEFPKPLTDEVVQAADVVITMGCGDACPIYPGKKYEDWELEDPAGQDLETVRRIRDDLDARVQRLISELLPS
jgi:arsenate reductase (thioredoxin)